MHYGAATYEGIYEVPCSHPAAQDGLFRAKPEFLIYHRDKDLDQYGATYFIADVDKLIAMVQETDPGMMEHAKYKYARENAEGWLKNNKEYPYKTGSFAYRPAPKDSVSSAALKKAWGQSTEKQLIFSTGNAGMLILLKEAGVSQIPIGVQTESVQDTQEIIEKIGLPNSRVILSQKSYPEWGGNKDRAPTRHF